jgi:hypothetical protein
MAYVLVNDSVASNAIRLSETQYFDVEEIVERVGSGELEYCPESLYIRDKIQTNSKQYRDALSTFDLDSGEVLYQILFPITIVKRGGKDFLINGNSRVSNLISMYASSEPEEKTKFQSVPVNYILNEPTDELLLAFQRYANDTTISHSVLERLTKAESFFKSQTAKHKKAGLTEAEGKRLATESTRRALGNISQPQLSKIMSVSNTCKECELLKHYIENEQISIDGASQIISFYKQLTKKKSNERIQLEFVLLSIKAIAEGENNKNEKGLTLIQERHLEAYKESLKAVKVEEVQEKLSDLVESGGINSDARDDIEAALEEHKDKISESALITEVKKALSDTKKIIEPEDVKKALEKLKVVKPEAEIISVESLSASRDEFIEKSQLLNVAELQEIPNPAVSKTVAYFNSDALKLLVKVDRYFRGSESVEILGDVLSILNKRLGALEPALGENIEVYADIKKRMDELSNLSNVILEKAKAPVEAPTQASTKEIEIVDKDEDSDVFTDDETEDGEENITATDGNFTATVE